MKTVQKSWDTWENKMKERIPYISPFNTIELGSCLGEIFFTTSNPGRSQSTVSGAGNAWEALVCWYLNLNLIGSRTVVVKQTKSLVPEPIKQALTVSYGTFPSGTESDLIAITFPDKSEYINDIYEIDVRGNDGKQIPVFKGKQKKVNYKELIDALLTKDFGRCEIGVLQCKTNWNDNAQIPMLWDMIYSSDGFTRNSISVGSSMFSIKDLKKFTYSFVTVPTVKRESFKINSTSVKRVQNLSGGNYWGFPTKPSIANSLKDIFGKNFSSGSSENMVIRLEEELKKINTTYSYFKFPNN